MIIMVMVMRVIVIVILMIIITDIYDDSGDKNGCYKSDDCVYHTSYNYYCCRDLPLKINQWANVVRWELRYK